MAQYSAQLDGVFVALADPTRRWVIRRLGHGPTSVGDLAREFPMTLPSFMKHVQTLESNGLIRTTKSGRVRTCVLNRERLALVDDWLAEQRRIWEERTDRLERLVTDQQENQQMNPDLDLTMARVIRAPRAAVWSAWTDPSRFEKWWIPAPALCRVDRLDVAARWRARDPTERGRGGVRPAPRRVLPRRRRPRTDRVHQRDRQRLAAREPQPRSR